MKRTKFLLIPLIPFFSYSQKQNLKQIELDLLKASNKLFSFYQPYESDSLHKYSEQLRIKTIESLSKNPATLKYPFQMLIDSNAFAIVTSNDSLFRIYTWDTWTGGTMHFYDIIYQFSNKGKVYTEPVMLEEGDAGAFYSEIFTLKSGTKTYYLAVSNATFSTKDAAQSIEVFSIENNNLNKQVNLIKTAEGMTHRIGFEFDFFSVVERPERPLKLIKYDKNKKIIFIPVVYEDGKVTDKFIQYKFNGKYFKKYKIE
jgi:hypothetical protein